VLKIVPIKIDEIYVPTGMRKELDEGKVEAEIENLMEEEEVAPIQVRKGKGRYVLVKGLHRVEAAKAVGEESIDGFIVAARKH
jgi:sulfiredoxin